MNKVAFILSGIFCSWASLIYADNSSSSGLKFDNKQSHINQINGRFELDPTGACITDKKTGLMWAKDANLFGGATWGNSVDNYSAQDQINRMNSNPQAIAYHLCGYGDWRLPTRYELHDLIASMPRDNQCSIPIVLSTKSGNGFTDIRADRYWAGCKFDNGTAWYVSMSDGRTDYGDQGVFGYVWPVRKAIKAGIQ